MVLIQRRNKEKYEYMLQGWRRYGEEMQARVCGAGRVGVKGE